MKKNYWVIILALLAVNLMGEEYRYSLNYNKVTQVVERGVTSFEGTELYGNAGQGVLPVEKVSLLLPPSADMNSISIELKNVKEIAVEGYHQLKTAAFPQTRSGEYWYNGATVIDGKDVNYYESDAVLPQNHVLVRDQGMKSCFKIVDVMVNLYRYNPKSQQLYKVVAGDLTVSVEPLRNYSAEKSWIIPNFTKKMVAQKVANFNEFASLYDRDFSFTDKKKMVILTTKAIVNGSEKFEPFLQSKKEQNLDVTVVTEEEWGGGSGSDAALNIRKWLQANYKQMGIHHLLLIGNNSGDVSMMIFPDFNTYIPGTDCLTDWPYTQLTNDFMNDAKCEINVGRIPVYNNDYATLDAYLQKVMDYTNADKADIAWRYNVLMGAGGFAADSKGDIPFELTHKDIIEKLPDWKDYRIYGTAYGQPTGTPDKVGISDAIFSGQWKNNQYGLVTYLTHGSSTGASHVISSSSAAKVSSKNPSFVICGACTNSSPKTDRSLCFTMLKNGAIGTLGGTSYTDYEPKTLTYIPTAGSNEGWAYNFVKCMAMDSMDIGECITYLRELQPDYPTGKWLNRAPYVLYGDPSISIYSHKQPVVSVVNNHSVNSKTLLSVGAKHNKNSVTFTLGSKQAIDGVVKIFSVRGEEVGNISVRNQNAIIWNRATVGHGVYIARFYVKNGRSLIAQNSVKLTLQ